MTSKVAQNAVRLAQDAELLFERGRSRTALALAILSLEEAGKYYLLSRGRADVSVDALRRHVTKQVEASWFVAESILLAFFRCLAELGFDHKPACKMTGKERVWLASPDGRSFEASLMNGEMLNGLLDRVVDIVTTDGVITDFEAVRRGDLNRLKQAAFYSDPELMDMLPTDPGEVSAIAKRWIDRAGVMADRARRDTSKESWGPYVTVMRDDLIGEMAGHSRSGD